MTLRKSFYLVITLGLIAAFVGCSTNAPPKIAISASSGSGQSVVIDTAYATFQAGVTSNGAPASNLQVTFTAPQAGPSCVFASNNTNTETDPVTNGVATSSVCTANSTAGAFVVTASVSGANGTTTANFSLTNLVSTPIGIEINTGNNQIELINGTYANPLVATVFDMGGNPVPGVSVTFTAPTTGATGTFAQASNNTDTETTDANGNATTTAFTANGNYGPFNVAANFTGNAGSAVQFALINSTTTVAAGNYVFSVTGTDNSPFPYTMAGVFTLTSDGIISTGEFDFADFNFIESKQPITGGQVTEDATGNFVAKINFTDPNGYINGTNGFVIFNGTMLTVTSTTGTLIESDGWASGSGDINLQTSTTFCATTPCSYAFFLGGLDWNSGAPTAIGGVITVDTAAASGTSIDTISGTGSIYDVNDGGSITSAGTFVTNGSTVSSAADTFGLVTFSLALNVTGGTVSPVIDAYMIDANHFRLVEELDGVLAAGGAATAQTGAGKFSSSNIGGDTYVFGVAGQDGNGALQSAGVIGFDSSDSNITGNVSWNDITGQNQQGGTTLTGGTFAVDSGGIGDVTVTGITDGTFTYNFQMYLTGDGHAYVISVDTTDVQAGRSTVQGTGLSATSFDKGYALDLTQVVGGSEQDGTGPITADGVGAITTGAMDFSVAPFTPTSDLTITGTFVLPASSPNGVWTGTIADPVVASQTDNVTYYVIDATQGVIIENDTNQLTLGYYTNQ
jgi:hypothetical protein